MQKERMGERARDTHALTLTLHSCSLAAASDTAFTFSTGRSPDLAGEARGVARPLR
jgi:hypothetical protein